MLKPNLFPAAVPALILGLQFACAPQVFAEPPATPGAAQTQEIPMVSDTAERKIIEHMQETNLTRLKGWPGMIFYCPTDEAKTPTLKQICLDTYKNLEALAVQNNVKFHKARNANDMALLPHLTGRLEVVIDLTATDPGVTPSAISGRIAVLAHYAHAVNRSAELTTQEGAQIRHPLSVPQHVNANLWESTVIKASTGSQEQLTQAVVEGINEKLKAFFADYAKANR